MLPRFLFGSYEAQESGVASTKQLNISFSGFLSYKYTRLKEPKNPILIMNGRMLTMLVAGSSSVLPSFSLSLSLSLSLPR